MRQRHIQLIGCIPRFLNHDAARVEAVCRREGRVLALDQKLIRLQLNHSISDLDLWHSQLYGYFLRVDVDSTSLRA